MDEGGGERNFERLELNALKARSAVDLKKKASDFSGLFLTCKSCEAHLRNRLVPMAVDLFSTSPASAISIAVGSIVRRMPFSHFGKGGIFMEQSAVRARRSVASVSRGWHHSDAATTTLASRFVRFRTFLLRNSTLKNRGGGKRKGRKKGAACTNLTWKARDV